MSNNNVTFFSDEELIEQIQKGNYVVVKKDDYVDFDDINSLVEKVWLARVLGAPNLDEYLNELFNEVLNRSI